MSRTRPGRTTAECRCSRCGHAWTVSVPTAGGCPTVSKGDEVDCPVCVVWGELMAGRVVR